MRKLIFTLILILAGIIAYFYFFGKGEEKSTAETIVRETKELGIAVGDFLKHQKEKYDDGEFDQLLDKVKKGLENLKSNPDKKDPEVKNNLRDLEDELKNIDPEKLSEENRKALEKVLEDIHKEVNQ